MIKTFLAGLMTFIASFTSMPYGAGPTVGSSSHGSSHNPIVQEKMIPSQPSSPADIAQIRQGTYVGTADRALRVEFRGEHIFFTDGCNQYNGTLDFAGNVIHVTGITSTRVACPPARMRMTDQFLDALEGGELFNPAGDTAHVYLRHGSHTIALRQA
ncbi:hypothetical protein CPHO_11185 [Corynebacterium phocae]|uniref:DUF306 domain-containing protein n=1 Tax=Corynebacterium phocae TaxID=161895 RepID=A0A1L7D5D9_9CORY|nr:META domain-containing protein [Corynebacterium phocae]APT93359.1 hypothetical protein CPHO_11185 [Corynebacterium phocae]KAA8721697.1 META domain-containing protein [Corynebacterium phocae]